MDKPYVVYCHLFPNGKRYIGITKVKPYTRRWRNGSSYKKQPKMYNAIKKYEWCNVEHLILFEKLDKTDAESKEIELIKKYNSIKNGYNQTAGGKGTNGMPCSDETKKKIGLKNKGNKPSQKQIDMARERLKGKPSWNKGIPHSEEHREKCAKKNKKRCNKKIASYDESWNLVNIFESCSEASREIGVSESNISRCARGGRPTAGGYKWRYVDDNI